MQNSFVFPSLLALLVCAAAPVSAQSVTSARDGTGTVITRDGDRYVITGGRRSGDGANLFQSFERLGLNANEIATFMTQPGIANILGRVTGGDASVINGLLQVSGGNSNLYLINPAGILFGANARLDIPGSFTATTASGIGFGNSTFNAIGENSYADLVGTPDSYAFTLSQPGAIANAGDLAVNPGESLSLLGGVVVNTGTLSAPGGTVTVAAIPGANRVRVSQDGALLSLELEAVGTNATNPIPFTPLSLPQLLTGGNLGNASSLTVAPDGTVRLAGAVIPDVPGTTVVSGIVNAAGAPAAEINVLGDRVALLDATLNASATNGGGTVRIGGDYLGQGNVFNALNAFVSADSVIAADALTSGNGGRVIVWADNATQFAGSITARGGTQNGNGGFVETSGRLFLDVIGARINASADNGLPGTWLLDPINIEIVNGGGTVLNPTTNSTISPTTIQNALNGGTSVTITTSSGTGGDGDIRLTNSINATATNNATLRLTASRYISGVTGSTINISNGNLILDLNQEGLAVATNPTLTNAIATIGTITGGTTTINVGAGVYREQAEVVINRSMTINGTGQGLTFFDGDRNNDGTGDHRVFSISSGIVNLNNLTIRNGSGSGGAGGGIYNGATLTLTNSTLSRNTTSNSGGGIFGDLSTTTTVTNSTLTGNTASIDGGGINHFGTLTLSNSTVSNNTANGSGGGIFGAIGTTTTVTNSTFTGNRANNAGGGISTLWSADFQ